MSFPREILAQLVNTIMLSQFGNSANVIAVKMSDNEIIEDSIFAIRMKFLEIARDPFTGSARFVRTPRRLVIGLAPEVVAVAAIDQHRGAVRQTRKAAFLSPVLMWRMSNPPAGPRGKTSPTLCALARRASCARPQKMRVASQVCMPSIEQTSISRCRATLRPPRPASSGQAERRRWVRRRHCASSES